MKMEPLIPDPNGRWGYIRKGTPRQWNPDCQAQGVRPKDFQRKFNGKAATLLKMAFGLVDDLFAAVSFPLFA